MYSPRKKIIKIITKIINKCNSPKCGIKWNRTFNTELDRQSVWKKPGTKFR